MPIDRGHARERLVEIRQLVSRVNQAVPPGVDGTSDVVRAGLVRRVVHKTIKKLGSLGKGRLLDVLGYLDMSKVDFLLIYK